MEYEQLMLALRKQAIEIAGEDRMWTAAEVSRKLDEIAEQLHMIKHQHQTGIDASMGKRSGGKLEI